ncbi:MAG: hypothetical protein PUP93_13400 [Rhizonema sp. NSF051]|nr:hypothetical protein [Rhizonema sp. NSF051]
MSLNYLELRDIDNLVNLLLRSQQSKTREALCIRIGVEPYRLSFIRDSSDSDFLLQLIEYLDRIGNKKSLCKLCCEELLPIFCKSEIYAPVLREITVKLDCSQEFIPNSNNTEKKTTRIETIIKPKSKLHINRASFLIISVLFLSLSAIYTYFWFPDIWSSVRTRVQVDAKGDPWLAGMPDKSQASSCPSNNRGAFSSIAPQNSPTEVTEIPLKSGSYLTFNVQGGLTQLSKEQHPSIGAEGNIKSLTSHDAGAQNGISNIKAPINSLVGVFLGAKQPNKDSVPQKLIFDSPNKLNYSTISPQLQQVFFIGDGRTNKGIEQKVIVPLGAKRLYLGIMDACSWGDNTGSLDVEVTNY